MTCIGRQYNTAKRLFGIGPAPKKFGAQKLHIFDAFATQWQLRGPMSLMRNMTL